MYQARCLKIKLFAIAFFKILNATFTVMVPTHLALHLKHIRIRLVVVVVVIVVVIVVVVVAAAVVVVKR